MRLCLDENLRSKELRSRLLADGHEVVDPDLGSTDPDVWAFAQRQTAVVLTGNAVDFVRLARDSEHHAGLLLVYRDNDPGRDMSSADIAAAVGNVDAAYSGAIDGQVLVLNQFRWLGPNASDAMITPASAMKGPDSNAIAPRRQ